MESSPEESPEQKPRVENPPSKYKSLDRIVMTTPQELPESRVQHPRIRNATSMTIPVLDYCSLQSTPSSISTWTTPWAAASVYVSVPDMGGIPMGLGVGRGLGTAGDSRLTTLYRIYPCCGSIFMVGGNGRVKRYRVQVEYKVQSTQNIVAGAIRHDSYP